MEVEVEVEVEVIGFGSCKERGEGRVDGLLIISNFSYFILLPL